MHEFAISHLRLFNYWRQVLMRLVVLSLGLVLALLSGSALCGL